MIRPFAVIALSALVVSGAPRAFAAEQPAPQTPSEQIALLQAIDEHEIDAAKEANGRNVPAEVKQFAQMMLDEHKRDLDETKELSKEAGIRPDVTDSVKAFKQEADVKLDSMKKLDDERFAKMYAQEMVKGHQQALEKLNAFVDTSTGALKDHFTRARDHVRTHLDHAQKLSQTMMVSR